ncbi:protein Sym1p [Trichomonascus vanleenenianus]|uniref:ethanol metabolism protein n=1 Tax=Trichomonascus vanleenenianus TaxID=2268995 RepID=UPI003ECA9654
MASFFRWYNSKLVSNPLTTNAISTATLFGLGDVIAQTITIQKSAKDLSFDYARTARACTYGGIIFAPIVTRWYPLISKIKSPNPVVQGIKRATVDQLVFAPLGIPLYFTCIGIMEGRSAEGVVEHVKANWLSTLLVNWTVWPAFQLLNFTYVPLNYRLLAVNLVSIAWNAFLSLKNASN